MFSAFECVRLRHLHDRHAMSLAEVDEGTGEEDSRMNVFTTATPSRKESSSTWVFCFCCWGIRYPTYVFAVGSAQPRFQSSRREHEAPLPRAPEP